MKTNLLAGMVLEALAAATLSHAASFEVSAFGAKGDGLTKDTAAIQKAIDACATAGGGEVHFKSGVFHSGSILLKSGVKLVIAPQAKILGSTNMADYPLGRLIYATNAHDIGIEGGGVIDGQGTAFWIKKHEPYPSNIPWRGTAQFNYQALKRPSFIHFLRCTNITLRNLLLTNSPAWTVHLQRCENALASALTLRSMLYGPNTDGIDINSCINVRLEDCDIITGDDGIVLKSTEPGHGHPSRDISVARCRIWSACNGFKIGTETHDSFENISVRDCHIYSASSNPRDRTLAGIALESVDGSHVSNISISNITLSGVKAPIFVRLGHRGGNSEKSRQVEPRVPGKIRNVRIENITATNSTFESSITGIPGFPVENITLANLSLHYEGGGESELAFAEVPDEQVQARYPEAQMFGRLPAYGLYLRHIRDISLSAVHFSYRVPDARPAIICDDVIGLQMSRITAARSTGEHPFLDFIRTSSAILKQCVAPQGTALFLKAEIEEPARNSIVLDGNDLSQAQNAVAFVQPGMVEDSPLFQETSSCLFRIECEKMKLLSPMVVKEDRALPSGRYIEVPDGEGRDRGRAVCRFEIKTVGEYLFYAHALAQSGEDDSFYCAIDSGRPVTSDIRTHGKWSWEPVRDRTDGKTPGANPVLHHLATGIHTLILKNREDGARLDSIVIVRKGVNFEPSQIR